MISSKQSDVFGLSQSDLKVIIDSFLLTPSIERVILFGSRAKGNFKKGSDVDLAIVSSDPHFDTAPLSGWLNDESPLPYFFDVLNYTTISDTALKDHIDRVGKIIYSRV